MELDPAVVLLVVGSFSSIFLNFFTPLNNFEEEGKKAQSTDGAFYY